MKTGPKYKICKRLGTSVFDKCQTPKFVASEARSIKQRKHGRRSSGSSFGAQFIEKQKVRVTYGINERQFANLVKSAVAKKSATSTEQLYESLESRLDNIVYRLGLASSRRHARQLVSHGHIAIDGSRVTIPSYSVSVGKNISIRDASKQKNIFLDLDEKIKNTSTPNWLAWNLNKKTASMTTLPKPSNSELFYDLSSVMEFYSR